MHILMQVEIKLTMSAIFSMSYRFASLLNVTSVALLIGEPRTGLLGDANPELFVL